MTFQRFMSRVLGGQARAPKAGTMLGWLVSRILESENKLMAVHMVHALNPKPQSIVLELGPGHGHAIDEMLEKFDPKHVHGVEISDSFRNTLIAKYALESATENSGNVKKWGGGRISIHENDAKSLPFLRDASVDYVLANNVIYFLDPLEDYMQEIQRVLKPGGKLVWGIDSMATSCHPLHFKNTNWEKCMQVMEDCGFTEVAVGEETQSGSQKYFPLVGFKPN